MAARTGARGTVGLGVPLLALAAASANGAEPTTAECLGASEASLKLRSQGKLLDARAQLAVCAAPSCPADVRDECAKRFPDVNARIPSILFEVKDAAGNDMGGVTMTVDGVRRAQSVGAAASLDPGEHVFVFEAAGQAPLRKLFVLREGERDRRERVVFGATPPAGSAAPPAASVAAPPETSASSRPTYAYVLGAVGIVGLGVGSWFGLRAFSQWSDAQRDCGTGCPDGSAARGERSDALTSATVSTAAFAVGGIALAVGAYLVLEAPASVRSTGVRVAPYIASSGAGVVAGGAWQ